MADTTAAVVTEVACACLALVAGFIFWFVLGGLT
jgi:hypothetical protein